MLAPVVAQPTPATMELATGSITHTLTVSSLKDMKLVGVDGEEIGDIEGVVVSRAGRKPFALIKQGSFLGQGGRDPAGERFRDRQHGHCTQCDIRPAEGNGRV